MLYLLISLSLIVTAVALFARALLQKQLLPPSTQVTLGVFLVIGVIMTHFSLKEIEPYQYERVAKICDTFPSIKAMVAERRPVIQRYEYLEILEAETEAKKALLR